MSHPNMEYCAFRNTTSAINQIMGILEESDSFNQLLEGASCSQEKNSMKNFKELLEEAIEQIEELESND